MRGENEIGLLGQRQRQAIRQRARPATDGPAAQRAGAGEAHLLETRTGIGVVQLARGSGGVEEEQHMMQRPARARANLDGLHPFVFAEVERDHEVAVKIRPGRGHGKRPVHRHHHVRRAVLPAFGKLRQRRCHGGITFGRSRLDPLPEKIDLSPGQAALTHELTAALIGLPRRHVTVMRDFGDELGALLGLGIVRQGKRRGLARAMAACAILKNDGRDVPGEGDAPGRSLIRQGGKTGRAG